LLRLTFATSEKTWPRPTTTIMIVVIQHDDEKRQSFGKVVNFPTSLSHRFNPFLLISISLLMANSDTPLVECSSCRGNGEFV